MFNVRTGDRVRMERFDVEDNRDNVQLEPESGAQVGCLYALYLVTICYVTGLVLTSRSRLKVTPAPRNLQRCSEEKVRMA